MRVYRNKRRSNKKGTVKFHNILEGEKPIQESIQDTYSGNLVMNEKLKVEKVG